MAASPPPSPRKLFREPAQAASVQCPACGAPLQLRGFGGIEHVVCPYCGSESSPQDQGPLRVLAQVARKTKRARRSSALPLYQRGTLDGLEWEIIGIMWRACRVDGVEYPWQEFLLYNPYHGYRYLIFSMSDGHWSLGEPLPGAAATLEGIGHKKIAFQRKKYKHFQSVIAKVTYVEGEFPWQVHTGDSAQTHEYIAPPESISIESQDSAEGEDVNFTRMRYIEPKEVWRAFKMPGSPPPTSGIAPSQPNPWKKGRVLTWVSLPIFVFLWIILAFVYVHGRQEALLWSLSGAALEPVRTEMVVTGSKPTTLEFEVHAYPLTNAWASFDVVLSAQDRDEGLAFGAVAEWWEGVSDGEAWREGDPAPTVVLGDIQPGRYLLEITPSSGTATANVPPNVRVDYRLRQDMVLWRYVFFPLGVIFFFPLLYALLSAFYEGRRWSNSDYTSSE